MDAWLERIGGIQKSTDDFMFDSGRFRIVVSRHWDGLDQAYEWNSDYRMGDITGHGATPQDAVIDMVAAIDARVANLQELQELLHNLPKGD